MEIRRLVRGTLSWDRLERVAREVAERYDEPVLRITFLEADNWLSTPLVINDKWFVKIISPRNALVHTIFTEARNIGAFAASGEVFFERSKGPVEMAEHELEATRRMNEIGLHAPAPIEAFEVDGLGVLVLEYLDDYTTLDQLPASVVDEYASTVFESLATMHANELAHGDLREENVLVHDDTLYFIDATNVDGESIEYARAYDVASALAALEPHIGAEAAVTAAAKAYPPEVLELALDFFGFVKVRPDHDFDAAAVGDAVEEIVG